MADDVIEDEDEDILEEGTEENLVSSEKNDVLLMKDFDYNPQPLLKSFKEDLQNNHISAKIEITSTPPSFKANLTLSQEDTTKLGISKSTFESPQCASKKLAEAFIAKEFLTFRGKLDERWKKIVHSPKDTTPSEEIYKCGTVNISYNETVFIGTLQIGDEVFQATYPYHKDHSYCRHKLSMELLHLAAFKDNKALSSYVKLAKHFPFYLGRLFEDVEGHHVEFKGGKSADKPMAEKAVVNIGDAVGEEMCSFANAGGGSVYVGIHNSGVIQGIRVKDEDQFKLRLRNKLNSLFEPQPVFRLHLHEVHIFSTVLKTKAPTRPAIVDNYTQHIEGEYNRFKTHIDSLPSSRNPLHQKLYVLECMAAPAKQLIFFNKRVYVRKDNMKVELSISDMKQRIIDEYLQQQRAT